MSKEGQNHGDGGGKVLPFVTGLCLRWHDDLLQVYNVTNHSTGEYKYDSRLYLGYSARIGVGDKYAGTVYGA